MNKPVGGRGKKAPYESTHLRVPVPIKDKLQQIIDDFRNDVITFDNNVLSPTEELELLKSECQDLKSKLEGIKPLTPLEDAVSQAKSVLKQKKSKADAIAKLLTGIYGIDIASQDLLN